MSGSDLEIESGRPSYFFHNIIFQFLARLIHLCFYTTKLQCGVSFKLWMSSGIKSRVLEFHPEKEHPHRGGSVPKKWDYLIFMFLSRFDDMFGANRVWTCHRKRRQKRIGRLRARRAIAQFPSLKTRRSANFMWSRNIVRHILTI